MTTRPTPEQIAANHDGHHGVAPEVNCAESFRRDLERFGYVIVHPDDVPTSHPIIPGVVYDGQRNIGWKQCRDFIFAAAEQEPTS